MPTPKWHPNTKKRVPRVNMFCEYRHIFGKEGEGAHSYRVFGIAAVDLVLTILVAVLIS